MVRASNKKQKTAKSATVAKSVTVKKAAAKINGHVNGSQKGIHEEMKVEHVVVANEKKLTGGKISENLSSTKEISAVIDKYVEKDEKAMTCKTDVKADETFNIAEETASKCKRKIDKVKGIANKGKEKAVKRNDTDNKNEHSESEVTHNKEEEVDKKTGDKDKEKTDSLKSEDAETVIITDEVSKTRGVKRKISLDTSPAAPARKIGRSEPDLGTPAKQLRKSKAAAVKQLTAKLLAPSVNSGVVLTVGMGDVGQLGLGPDVMDKTRVAVVPGLPDNIVSVAAGGLHTVCLDGEGKVYTWGCNDEGALGRVTSCEEENFNAGCVEGIKGRVVQLAAGDCHSAALTEDGAVYAWGCFRDNNGPLGFIEKGNLQKTPRLLPIEEPVVKIASGNNHLAVLTCSGHLYTCGCGESGQLGRLAEMFATRDSRKRNGFGVLLQPSLVKVYRARRLVLFDDIWAGEDNTFARDQRTGNIYACGLNNYNQLGDPDNNAKYQPILLNSIKDRKWKAFSCGQHHGLALESSGRIYSMGRHDYGRLGLGEQHKKDAVIPTPIPALEKEIITHISAAGCVSLAVSEDGKAFGFGMGSSQQLSNGGDEDAWEPVELAGKQLTERAAVNVSAGGQHSVVLAVPRTPTD